MSSSQEPTPAPENTHEKKPSSSLLSLATLLLKGRIKTAFRLRYPDKEKELKNNETGEIIQE